MIATVFSCRNFKLLTLISRTLFDYPTRLKPLSIDIFGREFMNTVLSLKDRLCMDFRPVCIWVYQQGLLHTRVFFLFVDRNLTLIYSIVERQNILACSFISSGSLCFTVVHRERERERRRVLKLNIIV